MSGVPYPVVDVATWRVAGIETDGQTEHMWLERPDDQRLWLFKQVVVKEGRRQGEDWVEKIASVIAAAINVPSGAGRASSQARGRRVHRARRQAAPVADVLGR